MILFICLAQALELIKDFPSVFYLSENEFSALELPDFFSGNEIWYQVQPARDEIILKQSGLKNMSSESFRNKLQEPDKTNLFINIELLGTSSSRFAVYASGTEIYLFDSNLNKEFLAWDTFEDILSYTLIQSDDVNGVILLTYSKLFKKNNLIFSKITFLQDFVDLSKPSPIFCQNCKFEHFDQNLTFLSNGELFKTLTISGYINSDAFLVLYSVDLDLNIATEISCIDLGRFSSSLTIFTATYISENYVFVPQTNNLMNYEYKYLDVTLIKINSINLTEYNIEVTDMRLSNDLNYLLLGIQDGILIINRDFQEVFIDKFYMNSSCVQVTSSKDNIYLLLQNSSNIMLKVVKSQFSFYEIGFIDLEISANSLGWGIYNSSLTGFSIILNHNKDLIIKYIQLSAPYLNITSAEMSFNYTLTAFENSTYQTKVFNFMVSRPGPLGSIDYIPGIETQTAVFSGLKAEVSFYIYDYFCGFYIELNDIKLVNGSDLFSMEFSYNKTINTDILKIESDLSWASGMIISSFLNVFFYNSSSISILIDANVTTVNNFDVSINKIYLCTNNYLFDVSSKGLKYLVYASGLFSIDISTGFEYVSFTDIQCTDLFVTALNDTGLYLFKISEKFSTLEFMYLFNQTIQYYPLIISSFYLNDDNSICAIVNQSLIMMFNLQGNGFYPLNFPLIQFSVRMKPIKVFCYKQELYYVAFDDSIISVYNEYSKLVRSFEYQTNGQLFFTNQFIISISRYLLQVFDSKGYTCSIIIAEYILPSYSLFSYFNKENFNVYFLTKTGDLLDLSIDEKHSTAFITFGFLETENISEVLYQVNLNLSLSNPYNETFQLVPLNLFTNGETIYKNISNVKLLQNNLKDLDCEKTTISLENIFIGQDLNLTLEDPSKTLSVQQRLSGKQRILNIAEKYSAFLPIKSTDTFIFANKSRIWLLNYESDYVADYLIVEGDSQVECISLALIYLDEPTIFEEYVIFAAGCNILNDTTVYPQPTYALYFFGYNSISLNLLQKVDLAYEPSLMGCDATIGGKFVLLISDVIPNYMNYNFTCNHFQIVAGVVSNQDVEVLVASYLSPISLGVNYYYIIDFTSVFDPMFKVFYLYLLDWHFGIRIIRIDQLSPFQYNITNVNLLNGVAMTKCGRMMFISYDNTTVIKYHLTNWFDLSYHSQIFLYKTDYHAIPSTLECSSFVYSNYLIMLIHDNNQNTFLHIINNRVTELSSIIADEYLYPEYDGVYAFFDEVNNIAVITPEDFYLYSINDNLLHINPVGKCSEGVNEKVVIKAINQNNVTSFCSLELKIKKDYDNGNVSAEFLTLWIWVIIVAFITVFVLVGIKFARKYSGKKNTKKYKERNLFDYEFNEAIN